MRNYVNSWTATVVAALTAKLETLFARTNEHTQAIKELQNATQVREEDREFVKKIAAMTLDHFDVTGIADGDESEYVTFTREELEGKRKPQLIELCEELDLEHDGLTKAELIELLLS